MLFQHTLWMMSGCMSSRLRSTSPVPTFQMMITLSPPAQNGQALSPGPCLCHPCPQIYSKDPSLGLQTCTEQNIPGSGVPGEDAHTLGVAFKCDDGFCNVAHRGIVWNLPHLGRREKAEGGWDEKSLCPSLNSPRPTPPTLLAFLSGIKCRTRCDGACLGQKKLGARREHCQLSRDLSIHHSRETSEHCPPALQAPSWPWL